MTEILEGKNPVIEALRSGRSINKILLAKDIHAREIVTLAKEKGIVFEFVDRRVLDKKSRRGKHQGIIAYVAPHEYVDVEDILKIAKKKNEKPFLLILDGIEDPQNLGAIIRSADATGVQGVIIPKRRAAPLTEATAKASAGAVEYVPVARVTNIASTVESLKGKGVWVIGVDQNAKKLYNQADFKLPVALVVGSEGRGISRLVRERCEDLVSIPMKGKINSLNASVAAGIVMYEVLNQRRGG